MTAPSREETLQRLADHIRSQLADRPLRVAIDGISAAGKTTLRDELAALLSVSVPVTCISADDFHRPEAERHRRGRYSPEGYYHDAIDYPRLVDAIEAAGSDRQTVVIVDGVFLARPELAGVWGYRILVAVDPEVACERVMRRDAEWMGGEEEARRRYEQRYRPAELGYLESVKPQETAEAVFDNTDPAAPRLRLPD